MISSMYSMRAGDVVRLKRGRTMLPPWCESQQALKATDTWVNLQQDERMTIVGPIPYISSYAWLLFRHLLPDGDPNRWVMARDEEMSVVKTSLSVCCGQTALVVEGSGAGQVVIVKRRSRPTMGTPVVEAFGLEGIRQWEFNDLRIMVPCPDNYRHP